MARFGAYRCGWPQEVSITIDRLNRQSDRPTLFIPPGRTPSPLHSPFDEPRSYRILVPVRSLLLQLLTTQPGPPCGGANVADRSVDQGVDQGTTSIPTRRPDCGAISDTGPQKSGTASACRGVAGLTRVRMLFGTRAKRSFEEMRSQAGAWD